MKLMDVYDLCAVAVDRHICAHRTFWYVRDRVARPLSSFLRTGVEFRNSFDAPQSLGARQRTMQEQCPKKDATIKCCFDTPHIKRDNACCIANAA